MRMDELMSRYCVDCHDSTTSKGDLNLEPALQSEVGAHSETWEKVYRKIRARQMPPPGKKRPDEETYQRLVEHLGDQLDAAAERAPNPGRTETFRRLNRTEYQNAIRDLLAVEVDAAALLPKDEASHGFDNVTVGTLSPTLLDRYITAAQKISQLAVGTLRAKSGETYRLPADLTQEEHVEGLPLGTRGGALIQHNFPVDGEYEFVLRLTRDRNEEIEGLHERHQMELLLDGARLESFQVEPPKGHKNFELVDQHLKFKALVKAGPRKVGVTFLKNPSSLAETKRQPYQARYNVHRHPRQSPAVYQVSINGPITVTDVPGVGDTPSRRAIFSRFPQEEAEEEACAREILGRLMHRAFRRTVTEDDLAKALRFYWAGREGGNFETGIETALSSMLVSPHFLFRVERDPAEVGAKSAYRISDFDLASRLSFFIWSSIPDDELLEVAERGELHRPAVLEFQVRRMLADPRAASLASNFAGQWLYLRNLESITPDLRLFPDFDDNLRVALRRETELLFETVMREDRSVVDLLRSDFTFLNERLAKHYGVPHVYGARFRRVTPPVESERGGILRHGSVLTVTSYATRTSPVIRGDWMLKNIIGTPTPPPPPNTPVLKENTVLATLPFRERLAQHSKNAACASCHQLMDPVGFAFENFDAVGRWRTHEEGVPVDAEGGLPDGSRFTGIDPLEEGLVKRPELFVGTLTEKMMTFALGRGIEPYDGPAIRKILREAKKREYRFSAVVVGIVQSKPFTMRRTP